LSDVLKFDSLVAARSRSARPASLLAGTHLAGTPGTLDPTQQPYRPAPPDYPPL